MSQRAPPSASSSAPPSSPPHRRGSLPRAAPRPNAARILHGPLRLQWTSKCSVSQHSSLAADGRSAVKRHPAAATISGCRIGGGGGGGGGGSGGGREVGRAGPTDGGGNSESEGRGREGWRGDGNLRRRDGERKRGGEGGREEGR